jgi:hypothetical protein
MIGRRIVAAMESAHPIVRSPWARMTLVGMNQELSDKGFLVTASDDLIIWARTGRRYTADAVLLFAGAPPIRGPEAITRFWESRIRAGARAHTFELIETGADGKYAYQLSRAGVQLIRDSGERTPISGYTVRVLEIRATAAGKQRSTCSIGRTCRSRKLLNAASDGGKPCQDTRPNSLRLPCSGS